MQNNENRDVLEVRGTLSKGYGIIPKALMLDPEIPLTAKVLLGYFCSFTGNGTQAFPGRDRITSDLGIDKDTFSKYLKVLTAAGIVSVRQENRGGYGRGFCHNIYTVNIDSYLFIHVDDNSAIRVSDTGLMFSGYGLAPKLVMQAKDLSVQAKGIYLYLSVFANGDTSSPSIEALTYHLGISRNTYQRHMKKLTENYYVTVIQQHSKDGRMAGNVYELIRDPGKLSTSEEKLSTEKESYAPCHQISDTQNTPYTQISDTQNTPCTQISDTQTLPCTQISDTQKSDTIITSDLFSEPDLSINTFSSSEKIVSDGSIPKTSDEFYQHHRTEVRRTLFEKEKIPIEWAEDEYMLMTAVRVLTEWDGMNEYFQDAEMYSDLETGWIQNSEYIYRLFAEALTELLGKSRSPHRMLGQEVPYTQIYAKLSEWYEYDPRSRCLALTELRQKACDDYPKEEEQDDIRNPLAYMQSCIWSLLRTGPRSRPMKPPGRKGISGERRR